MSIDEDQESIDEALRDLTDALQMQAKVRAKYKIK